ncbi:ribonuclease H-like domain-containing protein [Tanacetum coccineum]
MGSKIYHKVKVIRCDNGTEFKNREMNKFCKKKGILRQYSIARTPQQNEVAERRNRTLIEAARTMLADSKLPTTTPTLSFIRPFRCPITILNTIDHLGKYDGKADEGFFIGYSLNSKAFRVFNSRTMIVEEILHIMFSKSIPNVVGSGLDCLFDIDALTRIMNYEPIVAGTQPNGFVGTKASDNVGQARQETEPVKDYISLPLWTANPPFSQDPKSSHDNGSKPSSDDGTKVDEDPRKDSKSSDQEKEDNVNSTNNVNVAGINKFNAIGGKTSIELPDDPNMLALEDYIKFDSISDDQDDGAEADMNNLDTRASERERIMLQEKGQPKLGLWYPKDSPFNLVAYTDSDYIRASLDRKSTTEGCQFLGCRLISWHCKKETVVANSTTEAEYVVASRTGSGSGPRCQETMRDTIAQTRFENVSKLSNDPLLARGNTLRSGEDSLKLQELMALCITLQSRVLNLETTKTTQANEIASLKRRVKKLEKKNKSKRLYMVGLSAKVESSRDEKSLGEDASKQGRRITDIVDDEDITLVNDQIDADAEMFDVDTLTALKSAKVQEKGDVIKEPSVPVSTVTTSTKDSAEPKKISEALEDENLSYGKKAIRTKWVYRNKKDERGVVVRNKGLFGLCFLYGIHSLSDGCEECLLVWFSRKETLLFQTMAVQDQAKMGEDEAVNEEMDDSLVRASTTATSLDAEHGSAPRGNTLRSGEDRLKLKELMELCTNLQTRVLNLETTKTTQANEIVSLKRRVKKQERRNRSRTHGLKRLYRVGSSRRVESSEDEGLGEEDASKQGRIADIDANEDIYLVNVQTDEDMFGVNNLNDDEVIVKISAAITTTTTTAMTDVEINLAQSLAELKSAKPKADKVVIQEPEQDTTTTPTLTTTTAATTIIADSTRPKAKGIVFHEQEQAPTPTARIEADYQLAQTLQAQEQEELTDEEKSRLFVQFLEKRRKHFAAKRAEEKRNIPSTRAQQRSIITELVEESSKKAEAEIVLLDDGDDVIIDDTPLSTKSPTIVDYKIYKEGKKSYFQIIRADVKARFKKTKPVNYMDSFLLLNLKAIVHCVTMQSMLFYLLVEKMYLLTNHTIYQMFNDVKLQVDYECEMAFELLRLVKKQLKEGYVPK